MCCSIGRTSRCSVSARETSQTAVTPWASAAPAIVVSTSGLILATRPPTTGTPASVIISACKLLLRRAIAWSAEPQARPRAPFCRHISSAFG